MIKAQLFRSGLFGGDIVPQVLAWLAERTTRVIAISHSEDDSEEVLAVWHDPEGPLPEHGLPLKCQAFRSGQFTSWESTHAEVCDWLASRPELRILSITQSEDTHVGRVLVWYWEPAP